MKSYDFLVTPEGKYFIYLIENLSKTEEMIDKIQNNRDFKIKSILYDDDLNFKQETSNILSKIKTDINKIPFDKPDTKKMEQTAIELDNLINYLEFYVGNSSE
jgi:hypothetical protein